MYYSKPLRRLLKDDSILLIYHGKISEKNLRIARIPINELEAVCREHGVVHINQVNFGNS